MVSKIRGSLSGGSGISEEQASIVSAVFSDFDKYIHTSVIGEPVRMLGELNVTDQRIQSLLREKDAEILRLRDRIFAVEKGRLTGG